MTDRAGRVRELLVSNELDAFVVSKPANIRYLTGFTGSNGTVVVTAAGTHLITDSRYTAWADREVAAHDDSTQITIARGAGEKELFDLLGGKSTVGLEASFVSWATADRYRAELGAERVIATTDFVEQLRAVKSAAEIEAIAAAGAITDRALAQLVSELRPGPSEADVARRLAALMYDDAGVEPSFDIIVASGANAAKPHHEPDERRLEAGDLVIIDSGATVDGYRSDMTRSFVLGSPTSQHQEMLDVVKVAQQAGVDAVKPGVATSEIDAACRDSLANAGYGEYFTHGTGHGVGLEIHEAPSVSSAATATLTPGHVITVEPGVYIPNVGGVRWEDTVVVTSNGSQTLTLSPKQPLIEL